MIEVSDTLLQAFIKACNIVAQRGLVRASSGNLSLRLPGDKMLITASRSWMENITAKQVCLCRISDGHPLTQQKPSVEIGFHAGIFRTRPDINAVLHFQSTCATALACRPEKEPPSFNLIPEIPFYIGPVVEIPYAMPGSQALADAVIQAMQHHDMGLIKNHGQVTVAQDLPHTIQNADFFELACEIILRNQGQVTPLTDKQAQELLTLRKETRKKAP